MNERGKIEGAKVGGNKRKRESKGEGEREKETLILFEKACKFWNYIYSIWFCNMNIKILLTSSLGLY